MQKEIYAQWLAADADSVTRHTALFGQLNQSVGAAMMENPIERKFHAWTAGTGIGEVTDDQFSASANRRQQVAEHLAKHVVVEIIEDSGRPDQLIRLFRFVTAAVGADERYPVRKNAIEFGRVFDGPGIDLDAVEVGWL